MKDQAVYLMYNGRNGYLKIGKSCNPRFREKTLQSEEPEVFLLAVSTVNYEKDLHVEYERFRLRGEWFSLTREQVAAMLTGWWGFVLTDDGINVVRRIYGVETLQQLRRSCLAMECAAASPEMLMSDEQWGGLSLG